MDKYVLVLWPESQEFMDEEWFDDEACLCVSEKLNESSAYFIPEERVINSYLNKETKNTKN